MGGSWESDLYAWQPFNAIYVYSTELFATGEYADDRAARVSRVSITDGATAEHHFKAEKHRSSSSD
jgi:hypothetical protein